MANDDPARAEAAPAAAAAGPSTTTEAVSSSDSPVATIEPLKLPTFEEMKAQDVFNNCAVRSVVSGVMGGGMGVFMGMLFGALENPLNAEQMTIRQNFAYAARQMGSKSLQMAKTFAIMGTIFSGTECVIEKEIHIPV